MPLVDSKTMIQGGPYREVLIVRVVGGNLADVEPDHLRDLALVGGFRLVNLRRSAPPAGYSAPANSRWYQGWITADIGSRPLSDLNSAVKGGSYLGRMAGWIEQQQLELTWDAALSAGHIGSTLTKQVSGVIEEGTETAQKAAQDLLASIEQQAGGLAQKVTAGASQGFWENVPWKTLALVGVGMVGAVWILRRKR